MSVSSSKHIPDIKHWENNSDSATDAAPDFRDEDGGVSTHPNWWSKYRLALREYAAEFMGTAILIIFGAGVDCQVVLSSVTGVASSQKGSYLSISLGWGIGTACGVWSSGGISGGHINPAVTIMLATYRGFPWRKVPGYIFAQVMGGLVGAALVYANYFHAIDIFEGGRGIRTEATASLFTTYALPYMTSVSCFFSEVLATAVLCTVVLAMSDKKNMPPPAGLAPLILFLVVTGLGAALGMQSNDATDFSPVRSESAYAMNPARDLGPRLLLSMVGYGKSVYTYRSQYWIWTPMLGPVVGAQLAAIFYDAFIYTGECPFNKPDAATRQRHLHAQRQQRRNLPAGPGASDTV